MLFSRAGGTFLLFYSYSLTSLSLYKVWSENTGGGFTTAKVGLQLPSTLLWELQRLEKQRRTNNLVFMSFYCWNFVHFILV